MLYLVTGLPGASKTLNTIKFVSENKDFQNRPIFYHNIKELSLEWTLLEDPKDWSNCPDGSVIILDEAQENFPARGNNRPVPDYIELLAKHRHQGFDIIFITQHPNLLDVFVRRLIGNHTHYNRPFGAPIVTRMMWHKCKDPDDHFSAKEAEKGTVRLDKKYFGIYKSAELHTHKTKIPKKLIIFIGILLVASYFAYGFYNSRIIPKETTPDIFDDPTINIESKVIKKQNHLISDSADLKKEELTFEQLHTPRIKEMPHTAPIYDHLTTPKVFPWPNCIATADFESCQCYTQQGTKMRVNKPRCKSIIVDGVFNPYLEPHNTRQIAPVVKERSEAAPTRRTTYQI